MKRESISLLLGYLDAQEDEIEKLYKEIESVEPVDKEKTVYLAYLLHNLYNAFEDLFREIAKTFENRVEDPNFSHKELLKRMIIEVPGVRPKVLSKESFLVLDELRGFRHVFRHAYTYELFPEKVEALRNRLVKSWGSIKKDLNEFKGWLSLNLN
ncbi:MAG TPA: hypothetical protein PKW23_05780 [Dictyoglomaceae bacterium]|nr:hypothetical protein [Dictyoglomaceae bacterium]HOL40192.1 hypothetical protein [Dictyoglomaceae bacterium]HPP16752.1 hypothetical protein [Dictyoglomaceae bacterium]HPU44117.1 hypothetical protein [Dictyoglomaceae bacterium]